MSTGKVILIGLVTWLVLQTCGCGYLTAGRQGMQDQQAYQRQAQDAGVPAAQVPAGLPTGEAIAYAAGSIGVLLSGLFLGKRYMPRKNGS